MFSLFGKKSPTAPSKIHASVSTQLQEAPEFPDLAPRAPAATCRQVGVEGDPSNLRLSGNPQIGEDDIGYLVDALSSHPALLLLNQEDTFSFEVWTLDGGQPPRPTGRLQTGKLHSQQQDWAGFSLLDVGCLTGGRLVLAVEYFTPQPSRGLFLFDPSAATFDWIGEADRHIGDVDRYFETRWLDDKHAFLLYYSGRTREAPKIYYNRYNHILLFSPDHPKGLEILSLGIDTGNVREWAVSEGTLFLRTQDVRSGSKDPRRNWSLALKSLL